MKKFFLKKFESNIISRTQVKKITGGSNSASGEPSGGGCGTQCATALDCADNQVCVTCPDNIPGKGCETKNF